MTIRSATADDLATLVDLEAACFPDAWSADVVAAELALPHRVVLVDAAGRGYVSLSVAGDVADVVRVAVHPDHRRSGLGRALLDAALDAATAAGVERVLLEVAHDNAAALGLYAAAGFADVSRRPDYYAGGVDAIVQQRTLTGEAT